MPGFRVDNSVTITLAVYEGQTLDVRALSIMQKQIITDDRAGGWRALEKQRGMD